MYEMKIVGNAFDFLFENQCVTAAKIFEMQKGCSFFSFFLNAMPVILYKCTPSLESLNFRKDIFYVCFSLFVLELNQSFILKDLLRVLYIV